ncbi:hypothetical protein JOC25_002312 [Solibacillus kalamii]|nr:hypothetical protein [Solibacillus kalamii]
MKIVQLTPQLLLENQHHADMYLNNIIHPNLTSNSWMNNW